MRSISTAFEARGAYLWVCTPARFCIRLRVVATLRAIGSKKNARAAKKYNSVSPARVSIPAPLDCLGKVIELAVKVKHST